MSNSLSMDTVLGKPVDIRIRKFHGALRVAGPGETLELSESAAFIFRQVNGARSVGDISLLVAQEYDVALSETADDVAEVLSDLVEHKVLDVISGSRSPDRVDQSYGRG